MRPYKDIGSLHTLPNALADWKCRTDSHITSFLGSPLRKAFFMCSWCRGQSRFVAKDRVTRTELSFAFGANVSS